MRLITMGFQPLVALIFPLSELKLYFALNTYWFDCRICFLRCKPDAETYNALINTHGRAGQWRWAMTIMEDMLRAAVCICIF